MALSQHDRSRNNYAQLAQTASCLHKRVNLGQNIVCDGEVSAIGQYTLSGPANVTETVWYKDAEGNEILVRTNLLRTYKYLDTGIQEFKWDRLNDYYEALPEREYYGKVKISNITAVHQRPIGNSSAADFGPTKHVNNKTIAGLLIFNNPTSGVEEFFMCAGYSEGRSTWARGVTTNMQARTVVLKTTDTPMTGDVATVTADGKYIFVFGFDPYGSDQLGICIRTSDWTLFNLSGGVPLQMGHGPLYPGAIELDAPCTGAACVGNYLYVAMGSIDTIAKYNISGVPTGNFISNDTNHVNPHSLTGDSVFNRLWFLRTAFGGSNICRGDVNPANGNITQGFLTLTFTPTLNNSLHVSSDGLRLYVVGGGTDQRIREYNVDPGLGTGGGYNIIYGQPGGFRANGALCTNDKFLHTDSNAAGNATFRTIPRSFVATGSGGKLFISDLGSERIRRYTRTTPSGVVTFTWNEDIMTIPLSYSVALNKSNANQMFIEDLEFRRIDGVWILWANWRAEISKLFFTTGRVYAHYDNNVEVFNQVATYPNYEIYAWLNYYPSATGYNSGTFNNVTPTLFRLDYTTYTLEEYTAINDGPYGTSVVGPGFHHYKLTGDTAIGSTAAKIVVRYFQGFIPSTKTPIYANDWIDYATFTTPIAARDAIRELQERIAILDNGTVGLFQPAVDNGSIPFGDYHISLIKPGKTFPFAQTARANTIDHRGEHSSEYDIFEIGNNTEYAGARMVSCGNWFFYVLRGEFYENKQTNIIVCLDKEGQKVAHHGMTTLDAFANFGTQAPRGHAANAITLSAAWIDANSIRVTINDENVQSGAQDVIFSGFNTYKSENVKLFAEATYPISQGVKLMDDLESYQVINSTVVTPRISLSSAPYFVDGDNYWNVIANYKSTWIFKSLTFLFRGRTDGGSVSQWGKVQLDTPGAVTKAVFTGRICLDGHLNAGTPAEGTIHLLVEDTANKKFVDIYTRQVADNIHNYTTLVVNGLDLVTLQNRDPDDAQAAALFEFMASKPQAIRIEIDGSQVTVIYTHYNRLTRTSTIYDSTIINGGVPLTIAEAGANIFNIDHIKVFAQVSTVGGSMDHDLTIEDFTEDYEQNFVAPTVLLETISDHEIKATFSEPVNATVAGCNFTKGIVALALNSVAGAGTEWIFNVGTMTDTDDLHFIYNSAVGVIIGDYSALELASGTYPVTNNVSASMLAQPVQYFAAHSGAFAQPLVLGQHFIGFYGGLNEFGIRTYLSALGNIINEINIVGAGGTKLTMFWGKVTVPGMDTITCTGIVAQPALILAVLNGLKTVGSAYIDQGTDAAPPSPMIFNVPTELNGIIASLWFNRDALDFINIVSGGNAIFTKNDGPYIVLILKENTSAGSENVELNVTTVGNSALIGASLEGLEL